MKNITLRLTIIFLISNTSLSYSQWSAGLLQSDRYELAAASYGNFAIFCGGIGASTILQPNADIYASSSGIWYPATISHGRNLLAGAAANNKIAFAGGADDWILAVFDYVDIYNVSTVSWSTATLSAARSYLAGAGTGTKILFAGGLNQSSMASSVVDIYETGTGSWTTSSLSSARYSLCGAAAGNKIVFAGGTNTNGSFSNVVDIYDVTNGTWTTTTLSQPRTNAAGAASGNKIYIAGGQTSGNALSKVIDVYDVLTNTWSIDSLSVPRTNLSGAAAGGKVFFAGGSNVNITAVYKTVDIFDTNSSTWSTDSLTTGRALAAATAVQNKFMIGGGTTGVIPPLSSVEIYAVTVGLDEIIDDHSAFQLMPNPASMNLQIGINNNLSNGNIEILNAIGAVVYESAFNAADSKINISTEPLTTGIYIVKVSDGKSVFTQKFIRN